MGTFDIIVGIVLIFFFLKGLKNGFIIELASVVALVLGIIAAVLFSEVVSQWLSAYITTRFISILSFFIVLIAVVVAVNLLAKMMDHLIKAIALGWLNRVIGALFGMLKAALIISVLLLLLDVFGLSQKWFTPEMKNSSYLYIPLEKLAPATLELINVKIDHLLPKLESFPTIETITT